MKRWIPVLLMMWGSFQAGAQAFGPMQPASLVFTDESFMDEEMVRLYPNPVIDILNIEVHQTGKSRLTVQIKDIIGKTLYNNTAGEFSSGAYLFQVQMPNAAPGMYLYNIIDDKGRLVANGKFVKQ